MSGTSFTNTEATSATTATTEPSRNAECVPAETAYWYASRAATGSFARLAASSCADCSVTLEPSAPARAAISSSTRWLNSAPMIATPKDEPRVRNSVVEDEATPMSFISTLFCATSMVICIRQPMPAPSTAMYTPEVNRLVSVSIWASRNSPAVISTLPTIGKTLYLPLLVVTRPATIETASIAPSIGRSSSPELVADAPCTDCWYSGRKRTAPNITKPVMKPMTDISVKLRLRKMCSGMTGSAALVCQKTKPTSAATPIPMSSMITAEPQAYSLPPQVVTSTMEVMPTVSRPAPR